MDNAVYAKFMEAKNTGNISLMKHLYKKNKNEVIIKFEYGKMLARNKQLREARKIFKLPDCNRNFEYFPWRLSGEQSKQCIEGIT